MFLYIVKRLLIGIVTLFVLVSVAFFLVRLMPGSPFEAENFSTETVEMLNREYGLDQPLFNQYIKYIGNVLQGDLGISFKKNIPIEKLIALEAPLTMKVGLIAFSISVILGIAIGIWQATTKSETIRGLILSFVTFGISMPNFIIALLLMMFFGVYLRAVPIVGLGTPAHYILPVAALSFFPIASISRLVWSSYSEAMQDDYVVMAKAKGLRKRTISVRHILKNAMIPVITYFGPTIAWMLTGSFVIESLFSIPGIGLEFVNAISNRDYTVVLGLCIYLGSLIIFANLVVDIICSVVDPRIRFTD